MYSLHTYICRNWTVDISFNGKVFVRASEVLIVQQDCSQTGGLAQVLYLVDNVCTLHIDRMYIHC